MQLCPGAMDGYDHLFKLLLVGDAGVGKSRWACGSPELFWYFVGESLNTSARDVVCAILCCVVA